MPVSIDVLEKRIQAARTRRLSQTDKRIFSIYKDIDKEVTATLSEFYNKYNIPVIEKGVVNVQKTQDILNKTIRSADKVKISRLQDLKNSINSIMQPQLLKVDNLTRRMSELSYSDGYLYNAWKINEATGINLKWAGVDQEAVNNAIYNNNLSKLSDKTLMNLDRKKAVLRIEKDIAGGMIRGDSYSKISRQISKTLGTHIKRDPKTGKVLTEKGGQYWKSLRVSRTEMNRAYNLANHDRFLETQKMGIQTRLMLLAVLDNRTREQSAIIDGQMSDENGMFLYPNGARAIAGNSGEPAYDINDRETTIEIIEDYSPKLRRIRGEGVKEFETFKQWADRKNLQLTGEFIKTQSVKPLTIPEIEEQIKNLGVKDVNLKGMDIKAAEEIRDELARLQSKYPKAEQIKSIITESKHFTIPASNKGQTVISLNKTYYKNYDLFKKRMEESIKRKWYPRIDKGKEVIHIFTHEYGHTLFDATILNSFGGAKGKKLVTTIKKIKSRYTRAINKLLKEGKPIDDIFISEYAKTNIDEFVAECLNLAENSKNPSIFAIEVQKELLKFHGGK